MEGIKTDWELRTLIAQGGGGSALTIQDGGESVDAATTTINFVKNLTATQTAPGVVKIDGTDINSNLANANLEMDADHTVKMVTGEERYDLTFFSTTAGVDDIFRIDGTNSKVVFGPDGDNDYALPVFRGSAGQYLKLHLEEGQANLIWVDAGADNLGNANQNLTEDRIIYTQDSNFTFINDGESLPIMRISAANGLQVGDMESGNFAYSFPLQNNGETIPVVLTQTQSNGQMNFMYAWNTLGIAGDNIAMGIGSMNGFGEGTGSNNVCIGYSSGDTISTADNNVCIGYGTGTGVDSSHNMFIGSDTTCSDPTATDVIALGTGVTATASGSLNLGSAGHPVGSVTADAVANVQSHKMEIWVNEVCYYLSLELKT